ncbi:hypothetical protein [Azorhizobium oxalatiphilum]|nr:hypothetical protein [Azorhizobium oxalatiphilum]
MAVHAVPMISMMVIIMSVVIMPVRAMPVAVRIRMGVGFVVVRLAPAAAGRSGPGIVPHGLVSRVAAAVMPP